MSGFGAVLPFELAEAAAAGSVCDAVQVISSATSLGGVQSTTERRAKLPDREPVPPGLLRLSVGCEHVDDLWDDFFPCLDSIAGGPARDASAGAPVPTTSVARPHSGAT